MQERFEKSKQLIQALTQLETNNHITSFVSASGVASALALANFTTYENYQIHFVLACSFLSFATMYTIANKTNLNIQLIQTLDQANEFMGLDNSTVMAYHTMLNLLNKTKRKIVNAYKHDHVDNLDAKLTKSLGNKTSQIMSVYPAKGFSHIMRVDKDLLQISKTTKLLLDKFANHQGDKRTFLTDVKQEIKDYINNYNNPEHIIANSNLLNNKHIAAYYYNQIDNTPINANHTNDNNTILMPQISLQDNNDNTILNVSKNNGKWNIQQAANITYYSVGKALLQQIDHFDNYISDIQNSNNIEWSKPTTNLNNSPTYTL